MPRGRIRKSWLLSRGVLRKLKKKLRRLDISMFWLAFRLELMADLWMRSLDDTTYFVETEREYLHVQAHSLDETFPFFAR